ncbi:hypothetical protein [Actinopolymorpha pittospori]|uniref:Uncharacterized protein n=1 Tax=Actinopolymorpha pittospori TaxID=648752 RepID=A0A927R960_9ACTN|nr:hypothetical protein [Actinopolymorpha pittospori]MBE1603660.1 hypothetical protein [Actinopolymorpha pittospori]
MQCYTGRRKQTHSRRRCRERVCCASRPAPPEFLGPSAPSAVGPRCRWRGWGRSVRSRTFLGARYRRIARRRGNHIAIVATGNTLPTNAYHLLADPDARFHDLGADHDESRINKERRARNLATQLQAATGQTILIRNGKAVIVDPDAA